MHYKLLTTSLLLLGITLTGCKKEEYTKFDDPNSNPIIFTYNVTASIGGVVVDENNNPVVNAQVTIGSNVSSTNAQGIFYFHDIQVDQNHGVIEVNKSGYFKGFRTVRSTQNGLEYTKIKLVPKITAGSFDNSVGATITVPGSSAQLIFEAGDVSYANGDPYSGQVNVYAQYLNPSSNDICYTIPGNFEAIDANNELRYLETYGMVATELYSPTGDLLNITPGQTVDIKMPVQAGQIGTAPTSIPMWFFDETQGIWIEEGQATLSGGNYIGSVSHFTWWNCDWSNYTVTLTINVFCNGDPVDNQAVFLVYPNGYYGGAQFTDANGMIVMTAPGGTPLGTLEVYDACGNVIDSQPIGTLTSNTTIQLEACPTSTGLLTGTFVDCNNDPITSGMITITYSGGSTDYAIIQNGQVSTVIDYCPGTTIDVIAYDYNGQATSSVMQYSTGGNISMGTIQACNVADEYITYDIDGVTHSIMQTAGNNEVFCIVQYPDSISINGQLNNFYMYLNNLNITGIGSFSGTSIYDYDGTNEIYNTSTGSNLFINVTTYPTNIGDYMEGTISGSFIDQNSLTRNITGSFRAKRE